MCILIRALIIFFRSVAIVTEEDYAFRFWPKLEGAILLILKQNPGQFIPISYEEMYRFVWSRTWLSLVR